MMRTRRWQAIIPAAAVVGAILLTPFGCTPKGKSPGTAASGDEAAKARGKAEMEKAAQQRAQSGGPASEKAGP